MGCGTSGRSVAGGVLEHTVGVLRHQSPVRVDAWAVWSGDLLLFDFWIVDASIFVVIVLLVCETSYEGRMVDALASRADEGRRSLR